jgi:hypothetical protein
MNLEEMFRQVLFYFLRKESKNIRLSVLTGRLYINKFLASAFFIWKYGFEIFIVTLEEVYLL